MNKVHQLLRPKGKLVGLLFAENFDTSHPPFGGTNEEFKKRFSPLFEIQKMELANNSIEARKGREFFIQLIR